MAIWHGWKGHPRAALVNIHDYRDQDNGQGPIYAECSECWMHFKLPPDFLPPNGKSKWSVTDKATTDEYRYGVDRSDA